MRQAGRAGGTRGGQVGHRDPVRHADVPRGVRAHRAETGIVCGCVRLYYYVWFCLLGWEYFKIR